MSQVPYERILNEFHELYYVSKRLILHLRALDGVQRWVQEVLVGITVVLVGGTWGVTLGVFIDGLIALK